MIVKYKLLGQPVNPVNRKEISLEINHDQESIINQPKPHVGINNLYFAREDILKVMAYLNNPPGITEGAPFDIEITEHGQTEIINMYLNLIDGFKRSSDGISVSVKMLQSLDWLDDRIEGFTLESMYNETGVASFQIDNITYTSYQDFFDKRCIFIPYVISAIPDTQTAFISLAAIIQIAIELTRAVKDAMSWATPMVGVVITLGVLQLVAELVFILLLFAAIIVLIIHFFDSLIQPIKYHGAMLLIDMLKIISQKIGINFQSSIWNIFPYNQIAYLPEKYNPLDSSMSSPSIFGISLSGFAKKGFTSPGYQNNAISNPPSANVAVQKGYMTGTGGDVLRLAKKICNGKIIIPDQTNDLVLERRDFYPAATPYQLPDIRQDWNGYNTDELTANILIRFADDLNDKNCIDKYLGTIFQATHSQIITNNISLVGLKGLREIQINAARGIRKTSLTFPEKLYQDFFVVWALIADAGIVVINIAIIAADAIILVINIYVAVWNLLMQIIADIVNFIGDIINAISTLWATFGGGTWSVSWNIPAPLQISPIGYISPISFINPLAGMTARLDALLLENDMVTTPKIILVDTARTEFIAAGGYSGQQRIAYLSPLNDGIIHAQWLWNNFYFIDAFVGANNNRFTKISPAKNKDSDRNPVLLSLANFKNLVSNPKFNDNFAEGVIADSIQWKIGDESGRADFAFRKKGWLRNPQSNNGAIRAQEININLQLSTSLPNGQ